MILVAVLRFLNIVMILYINVRVDPGSLVQSNISVLNGWLLFVCLRMCSGKL